MKILEILNVNDNFKSLVCEPFDDSVITDTIVIDGVKINDFSIPTEKVLFGKAKTRSIVVKNHIDIKEYEVNFV